jgi:1-acyl-sn-glycerol-3-phosphate acyltransferase
MEGQLPKDFKIKFNHQLYNYWKTNSSRLFKFTKLDCSGLEKIIEIEPAVLTPNHLNWKDILLTASVIRRPVSFATSFKLFDRHACYKLLEQYFRKYAKYPALKNVLDRFTNYLAHFLAQRIKNLGTIPAKLDLYGSSFMEIVSNAFQQNKLVCIFPEGGLASPGNLRRFKLGVAKILYDYFLEYQQSIPAYPIGITGTHRFFYPGMKVGFHVGSPLYIEEFMQSSERQTLATFIKELQEAVYQLIHFK